MPPLQLLRRHVLPFALDSAEIDDERVAPGGAVLGDAVLAAHQVADRVPRLGRELGHADAPVLGHVGALARPRRLVRRRHAQPRPDVARPVARGRSGEALRDHDEAMFQEVGDLLFREGSVARFGRCHGCSKTVWG